MGPVRVFTRSGLSPPMEIPLGRRRRALPTIPVEDILQQPRKIIKGNVLSGSITPREIQMPPPGFHMPTISCVSDFVESGNQPLGAVPSGFPDGEVPPPATRWKNKNIAPGEAKLLSARNADSDRQAFCDAESFWQMTHAPVCGDPLMLEEEFWRPRDTLRPTRTEMG